MDSLATFRRLLGTDPFTEIIGQQEAKRQLLGTLATGHHCIIIGPPGIGKTTLARNVARLLPELHTTGCDFHCTVDNPVCPFCRSIAQQATVADKSYTAKRSGTSHDTTVSGEQRFVRVQGSPDLTSEDLFGDVDPIKALEFGPLSMEAFTPGKLFRANNGVLFFDEINRCSEKLQNALLQALEESKVTLGGYLVDFPADFILIGTMNPEDSSTEPLSEVFLDRFDAVYMDYPETPELEQDIIISKGKQLCAMPEPLLGFMIGFVRHLRDNKHVLRKPSVRAELSLYERAQANALAASRDEVELDDIKDAVMSVLAHRIELVPSMKFVLPIKQFVAEEFSRFHERYADLKSRLGDYG
ncbi:AAA family ATPase [Candidatus Woesearchaeota archaeon CG_4_10_14_0_2_um_filter_57_5]|nr:MAG: hypothetical protein AUJ68_01915 [Candidatus Woesearchaeota archaeon CG1_02_57_44]PIZ56496.1 MAG: AAA family ATPase [Candidatus Woesearchaeota archaeon CG_4_10_14_0_2_um_filter_57_5]